jgi:hypothetical protein
MKSVRYLITLCFGYFLLISPQFAYAAESPASHPAQKKATANAEDPKSEAWRERMQHLLAKTLSLIPYVFDDKKFADPKNQQAIQDITQGLLDLSTDLEKHTGDANKNPSDPSLPLTAKEFREEIQIASSIMRSQQFLQAQGILKNSLSYCVSCHTQSATGARYFIPDLQSQINPLAPGKRILALTATRQFDSALKTFEKDFLAAKPAAEIDAFDFARALRTCLAIAVRVNQDPALTLDLLQKSARSPIPLKPQKEAIQTWIKAATEWRNEKPLAPVTSAEQLSKEADRLMKRAQKANQFPADAAGDIDFLRASTVLHQLVRDYPQSPLQANAFSQLGDIYTQLREFAIFELPEQYYVACVRKQPHSKLAQTCFQKYSDNELIGYTGSIGTRIPPDVRHQLNELKKLSQPAKQ